MPSIRRTVYNVITWQALPAQLRPKQKLRVDLLANFDFKLLSVSLKQYPVHWSEWPTPMAYTHQGTYSWPCGYISATYTHLGGGYGVWYWRGRPLRKDWWLKRLCRSNLVWWTWGIPMRNIMTSMQSPIIHILTGTLKAWPSCVGITMLVNSGYSLGLQLSAWGCLKPPTPQMTSDTLMPRTDDCHQNGIHRSLPHLLQFDVQCCSWIQHPRTSDHNQSYLHVCILNNSLSSV